MEPLFGMIILSVRGVMTESYATVMVGNCKTIINETFLLFLFFTEYILTHI